MKNLVNKLRECDGFVCEQVMLAGLAIAIFAVMALSLAQIV
jgi:hypothetical protein